MIFKLLLEILNLVVKREFLGLLFLYRNQIFCHIGEFLFLQRDSNLRRLYMSRYLLFTSMIILILENCCCFKYYNIENMPANNVDYEWIIIPGKYAISTDPLLWLIPNKFVKFHEAHLYREVLYKKVNGKWVRWIKLPKILNSDIMISFGDNTNIIWSDMDNLYIIRCTGISTKFSNLEGFSLFSLSNQRYNYNKSKRRYTIYMISKITKKIINSEDVYCIGADGENQLQPKHILLKK